MRPLFSTELILGQSRIYKKLPQNKGRKKSKRKMIIFFQKIKHDTIMISKETQMQKDKLLHVWIYVDVVIITKTLKKLYIWRSDIRMKGHNTMTGKPTETVNLS